MIHYIAVKSIREKIIKGREALSSMLFSLIFCYIFFLWGLPCLQAQESLSPPIPVQAQQGVTPSSPTTRLPTPSDAPVDSPVLSKEFSEKVKGEGILKEKSEQSPDADAESGEEGEVEPKKETSAMKEMSEIELSLSGNVSSTISTNLSQFGYDIFRTKVSTFAPVTDVPVGPDYIIGSGDRFTISLWGRIEGSYRVEVDRNGEITLPKVGSLKVWGLTFSDLREYLSAEFSKHFKGFHMNIAMDRLRSIRVFVVGEVNTPGSYTLSSLSTVYNALFAAGGPSKRGTMRNIRLMRNGKIIRSVDFYDFLLKGDKSQDERLQSGDTVFVPIIGPVAGIAGRVTRPAIYEMKNSMTLGTLLNLSGGVTPLGYLQRVQIERIVAHKRRTVEDLNLSEYTNPKKLETILIQNRDIVKVLPISPGMEKIVYLEGHVKRPGGYEFREGMKILELIPSFDQLLTEPYLDHAEIRRLIPPDFHTEIISFNLGRLMRGDLSQNIELKEFDRITVFSRDDLQATPRVNIGGDVQKPGKYRLLDNMTVKDLIYRAGNLKRSAYLPQAEITRLVRTQNDVVSKLIHINLVEALKDNPEHNIPLVEDDYLLVRQIPEWYTEKSVTFLGEVRFPGVYSISKGERLSSILARAGGFTEYAYLKGAFFTRESAKKVQENRIKGFIDKLEEDTLRMQTRAAEGAVSEEEMESINESMAAKGELLKKLKAAVVTGRVVLFLDSIEKFKGSKYDLKLESGDILAIPQVPGIVSVLGSVYNPTSILHTKNKTAGFYLNKVGGPTPDAEEGEMYIVRANGTVLSRTQKGSSGLSWDSEGRRWLSHGFMSTPLDPGDTILVPHKITRFVWKKELMDWTTILFRIAVSAGVLIAAF